jgi:hypothetical protein
MPAPNVTSVSITAVNYTPGDTFINVNVSIHRRIYRQATKKSRPHTLTVDVSYQSNVATFEAVSSGAVAIGTLTLLGPLPDNRREVLVPVPLGGKAMPSPANPAFNATVVLTLSPKPGNERDDDEGNDDSISDDTYDNS